MDPAVSRLEAALASTELRTPRIPVISNVDAQPHADPDTIKKILARQVSYRHCFVPLNIIWDYIFSILPVDLKS